MEGRYDGVVAAGILMGELVLLVVFDMYQEIFPFEVGFLLAEL